MRRLAAALAILSIACTVTAVIENQRGRLALARADDAIGRSRDFDAIPFALDAARAWSPVSDTASEGRKRLVAIADRAEKRNDEQTMLLALHALHAVQAQTAWPAGVPQELDPRVYEKAKGKPLDDRGDSTKRSAFALVLIGLGGAAGVGSSIAAFVASSPARAWVCIGIAIACFAAAICGAVIR